MFRVSTYSLVAAFTLLGNQAGATASFLDAYHAKIASLIATKPEIARQYIAGGVEQCKPDAANPYWKKRAVINAGIDAYVFAYSLLTPDRTKQQRSKEFADWSLQRYYNLPQGDRQEFSALMRSGFYGAETTYCISKSLQGKI